MEYYKDYSVVRVEVDQGVAAVYLDNPPINLFDDTMTQEVSRLGYELAADRSVRVVVVRSAVPGFFISHADAIALNMVHKTLAAGDVFEGDFSSWAKMFEPWRVMPKPTIAVIEGRCGGGGSEFAISCDMRFAARETAVFNQWEVSLGLVAGGGAVSRLTRLLGRSRSMEAQLGCDDFDATTAELYGWINRALPSAQLNGFVDRLAHRVVSFPPESVAAAKAGILQRASIGGAVPEGEAEAIADLKISMGLMKESFVGERLERFLEIGGQTVEGEKRLGEIIRQL